MKPGRSPVLKLETKKAGRKGPALLKDLNHQPIAIAALVISSSSFVIVA